MQKHLVATRAVARSALSLAICLIPIGCESASEGTVSGRVTYKQQPVRDGVVNFYAEEKGAAAQADLDDAGAFTMNGPLPVGVYKVAILPPLPEQLPPGSPLATPKPFEVPAKYQDAGGTPLTQEVKAGNNDFTIELTD